MPPSVNPQTRWTTIDSPVASKVVRQSPPPAQSTAHIQIGTLKTHRNEARLPADSERSLAVKHEGLTGTSKADLHTRGTSWPLQPSRSFTYVPRATQP